MKKFIAFIAIVLTLGITKGVAQNDSNRVATDENKSETKSALCTAQGDIINELIRNGFYNNSAIDIEAEYDKLVMPVLVKCVQLDMYLWSEDMRTNAENGKFKKFRLSFSSPEDATIRVPHKVIRKYKRVIKEVKKEFFDKRKKMTPNEILNEKNLSKKLTKTKKALKKQFTKGLKKASS